jgi:hypothetical protein
VQVTEVSLVENALPTPFLSLYIGRVNDGLPTYVKDIKVLIGAYFYGTRSGQAFLSFHRERLGGHSYVHSQNMRIDEIAFSTRFKLLQLWLISVLCEVRVAVNSLVTHKDSNHHW